MTLDQELPVSEMACVTMEFEGIINNDMAGFYRSRYTPAVPALDSVPRDDKWHYMFSTQFESCDARQAFPCFDEPNLKATFDFDIEAPSELTVLSNTPVKSTKPGSKDGWSVVSFERTPVMSSYLLAWAIGDFGYIEDFTQRKYNGKQIPVRLYTTRGLEEQGRWALEHAPRTIDYFSEIFDIDYPLPKSDLLCVHEFTSGAMENWGLVTYRTTRLLFDEKTTSPRLKNDIAYVVAHELAHQWFGNLVTMDWWDELWLNEGFATWVGWLAVDKFHPDWNTWGQFVLEGMDTAFSLDSVRGSHAIHVPVRDALDVNQIFDAISYQKGCSIIRMLANHLGVETFLKGVSKYLKAHAYGNAKTTALWDAISSVSGRDVNKLMQDWIGKVGHPVLSVEEKEGGLALHQERFLSTGDVKPEDDTTTWWVPLGLDGSVTKGDEDANSLWTKAVTVENVGDAIKVNNNGAGFYRINYSEPLLVKLGNQLDKLSVQDKVYVINSTTAMAFAGKTSTSALLKFLERFESDVSEPLVLQCVLSSLALLKEIFGDDETIRAGIASFTNKVLSGQVAKLGWDVVEGEHYLVSLVRGQLLSAAVASDTPGIRAEALNRYKAWAADSAANPLAPTLRQPVWLAGMIDNPDEAVQRLKKEWWETKTPDGKQASLIALGKCPDLETVQKHIVPFIFNMTPESNAVPSVDMHWICMSFTNNAKTRSAFWAAMRDNWDGVVAKLGGNPIILDRMVGRTLCNFADASMPDEVATFFKDKDTAAFNRSLASAQDHIRGRAAFRSRELAPLQTWFAANGY